MNYSLCLQSTYHNVTIAVCNDTQIIETIALSSNTSSATLVPHIDKLLDNHNLSLANCIYIAVNQGPGPFTTLRTILATVQGIAQATRIPLIGIDGLHGLISRSQSQDYLYTIALLNAFNNELYYAIASKDMCITGYGTVGMVTTLIQKTIQTNSTLIIGNGIPLIKDHPEFSLDASHIFFNETKDHCTIEDIAYLASKAWNNKKATHEPPMPLYLKKHAAERV